MSLTFLLKRTHSYTLIRPLSISTSHITFKQKTTPTMGKKKSSTPGEENLLLPTPPSHLPIVDTHTHIASTFEFYRGRYKQGKYLDVHEFVRAMYDGRKVEAVVDVWCEAPVRAFWREFADAAKDEGKWGGMEYWFVMGVHPHEAKLYTDDVEKDMYVPPLPPFALSSTHPSSQPRSDVPPPLRRMGGTLFARQLRQAVRLEKPLTIHTREAEEDTVRILKEEVPREYKIHIHCFTDSPEFAQRLLDHFPNLYIGITGVISYATNHNTSAVIRNMVSFCPPSSSPTSPPPSPLRILLETDAPFMVPANLYDDLPAIKGKKLPICHSAMVPWTAKFVADVANQAVEKDGKEGLWTPDEVMRVARENARRVYGV
ncbi:hypothetical protein NLJ89_g3148 [Agrocybe chaxingu]|uniref:Metallo-dependent hydrolase n=1 Tax=Agrocybe chaxingu TaxID=84603 RepID=A0A9W8K570_9AGAR|nr:hypothetical protein NLJ89_g3148 [Agrocybe chaxingu]